MVDGKVNATDIASMSADKYRALYQLVPTSLRDLESLTKGCEEHIAGSYWEDND